MAYPNVEKMLVAWLSTNVGVRVLTDTPTNLAQILPVVQVTKFGGTDQVPGIDVANVDIDVYASTRDQAAGLAERVRYQLRMVLPGQQVAGITVSRVETIIGPSWRPYDNTSLRRFGASYAFTLHAKTIREATP
jgi:hypothetical protein